MPYLMIQILQMTVITTTSPTNSHQQQVVVVTLFSFQIWSPSLVIILVILGLIDRAKPLEQNIYVQSNVSM